MNLTIIEAQDLLKQIELFENEQIEEDERLLFGRKNHYK